MAATTDTVAPTAAAPVAIASPLGLGFGRLRLDIDGPISRVTTRGEETISGKITGGEPRRLVISVNGVPREIAGVARQFDTAVHLVKGENVIRVVAVDDRDREVHAEITVQYVPPLPSTRIAITRPQDGSILGADDVPMVVVEGSVEAPNVSTVSVIANERRLVVPVEEGRFRSVVPVLEPVLRVWAETSSGGMPGIRSEPVTVRAAAPLSSGGIVIVDWPKDVATPAGNVVVTWRQNSQQADAPVETVATTSISTDPDRRPTAFYFRGARPGVYTVSVSRAAGGGGDLRPTLYLAGGRGVDVRATKPLVMPAGGRAIIAKVLLPFGVLWDDDDWFTGRSEASETITKFRLPEGVAWTERRGGGR